MAESLKFNGPVAGWKVVNCIGWTQSIAFKEEKIVIFFTLTGIFSVHSYAVAVKG